MITEIFYCLREKGVSEKSSLTSGENDITINQQLDILKHVEMVVFYNVTDKYIAWYFLINKSLCPVVNMLVLYYK